MATTNIKVKRSSVEGKIPLTTDLALGEFAVNTYDGKLFLKRDNGISQHIVEVGGNQGFYVKNQSGALISKGTLVGFVGTVGNSGKLLVAPFLANGSTPSEYFMGVVSENIPNGGDGFVIDHGTIYNLDTSAWAAGTVLYASSTVPGAFTSTLPQAPNNKITVAAVVNSHQNVGVLEVRVTLGSKLQNDELVELGTLAQNHTLAYNATNSRFENTALKTVNGQSLFGSGDISSTTGVNSFNTRSGAVTLTSSDVTSALGYTPYNSTNPNGYITSSALTPYITSATAASTYQPLDADLTSIAGLAGTSGLLKKTAANTWSLDTNTYLTGNQSISISGDATGSGTTAIALTLANSGVTAGTYTKVTVDAKGRATSGTTLSASDIPNLDASKITTGTLDAARLPSYVDDVLEYANLASFPASGESGKIYVALDTNKTYRWSGSAYIYITSGAVDSVAGKTGVVTLTSSDVGLGNVENKSSATIRGELTSANVTGALGFTPYNSTNPSGFITSSALSSYLPLSGGMMSGLIGHVRGSHNYFERSSGVNVGALGWHTDDVFYVAGHPGYGPNAGNDVRVYGFGNALRFGNNTYGDVASISSSGQFQVARRLGVATIQGVTGSSGSDGQMVIDSASGQTLYLNHYNGGIVVAEGGYRVLNAANYNSYSPTLTGTGASGTWNISVTGTATRSTIEDTRAAQRTPNAYDDYRASYEFTNQITGISDWHTAFTMQGWHDGYAAWQIIGPASTGAHENWYLRSGVNTSWNPLRTILHSGNYSSYSPSLTGSGASGTWGISISGNAATVSSITSSQVTTALGYTPYNSTNPNGYITSSALSSYLPLSGGTLTGRVTFPSATANQPQMPNGYLGLDSGDGNFDIWGISRDYYPSHATAANAWGIRWDGDSNQVRFIGGGSVRLAIDLDGGANGALTWEGDSVLHAGNYTSYEYTRLANVNSNPDNSHPGYGIRPFYSWNIGQANNASAGFANGISIGSHPGDPNYGFQIVQNMWDDQLYFRRYNYGWQSWRTALDNSNYSNYALPLSGGTIAGNGYIDFGPNSTWGATLRIGGNGHGGASRASVVTTNGNLHLDGAASSGVYLNWYATSTTGTYFGNGAGGQVGRVTASGSATFSGLIDTPAGYVSNGNPWGTSNSAFFPNGITTAGSTNWIYGSTYIGNAPGNGSGLEVASNGRLYSVVSSGTAMHIRRSGSASNATNAYTALFENDYGDHSWGIVAEFRAGGSGGSDRPSILFSNGYNSTTWSVGFGGYDDQFRINQNHGYRNGSWGTERFRIDTGGTPYFNGNVALHAGNYTNYTLPTWSIQGLSNEYGAAVNNTGWYTIATHGGARGYAEFWVYDTDSSRHNFVQLGVVFSFGAGGITVLSSGRHGTSTIRHARLLYNTSNQTYGGAKLQIYCENPSWTIYCRMGNDDKFSAWSEWAIITPVQEDSPSGWAEYTRVEAINDQGVIGGTRLRLGSTDALLGGNQALHAGNYSSYALPLSGGTLTGNLYTPKVIINANSDLSWGGNYGDGKSTIAANGSAIFLYPAGNGSGATFTLDNSSTNVYRELYVSTGGSSQVRIVSPSGTQSLWIRAGYTANGTGTPLSSPYNVQFQSSGSSGGTFSFCTGNDVTLSITGSYVNSAVALQQAGNQVLHAGNYTSYRGTQLVSPNGATVVAADSAMPDAGQSFIHTLGYGPSSNDGHILGMSWANTTTVYGAQIWLDTDPTNRMAVRSRNSSGTWNGWSEVLTSGNYTSYSPSLTGSGASGTWGISITGNAATAYGLDVHTGRNNEANKVVRTDGSGYIQAGWINTTSGDNGTTAIDRVYASSDGYIRYYTPANFRQVLDVPTRTGGSASGTWSISITGSAAQLNSRPDTYYIFGNNGSGSLGTTATQNVYETAQYKSGFWDSNGASWTPNTSWWWGATFAHQSNSSSYNYSGQLAFLNGGGGDNIYARTISGGTPSGWSRLLSSGNYNSYSPSLTGSGASGTWGINITGNSATVGSKSSSVFHQRIHYGTTAQNSGYYKIRILPATSWMLSFTIRFYQSYQSFDVRVSGYNYGGSYWYSPEASLMDSSATSMDIRFGYDSAYNLWVAVPSGNYTGIDVLNVVNGYTQFDGNYADMFAIEFQSSLTGTVQTTQTIYRPLKYNENAVSATTASTLQGYGPNQTGGANTIVQRDGNGYIQNSYFYTSGGGSERNGSGMGYFTGYNTGDYYIRSYTAQAAASLLSGTSMNIAGNAATASRAAGNFYIDSNYGRGIVGVYSSYRYQGVFAMGDSYKLADDGTTTGSLYGIAWSHPNAGGAAGNLTDHGMLIINNGAFKCAISNSIVASGNITAYSDERLKTNWRDMPDNYVARLAQVRVGIYDRIDEDNGTQVGVSAQSFQELLPQAIITAKDEMGTLSVSYGNAALASAVELAKDNVELRARIERLESLIEQLLNKE